MTSTRCRVCRHVDRVAIESACTTRSLADVAETYALSESALERHVDRHPPADTPSGVRRVHTEDELVPDTLRSPGQEAA